MASEYRVLGQQAPAATTPTTLYTVPGGKQAIVSSVVACNRAATEGSFRIAIRVGGGALADKDYLVFDTPCPANDSITLSLGITLGAADVLEVYASSADFSFSAFGSEITP